MRNINRAGILMVAAISALFVGISPAGANHGGPHCGELPDNITPDHPHWHDSLDRDDDGFGCDHGGGRGTPAPEPEQVEPRAETQAQPETPAEQEEPEAEPAPESAPAPNAAPAEPQVREPTYTG